MSKEKNHKIQIWVAIIGFVGVIISAVIGNWDKITSTKANASSSSINTKSDEVSITILLDQAINAFKKQEKKKNGSYHSIIEKLNKILKYMPDNPEVYYFLAKSHRRNGDSNTALIYIDKAIAINGGEYKYLYEKGYEYEKLKGEFNKAISFYKKALEKKNSKNEAYARIAICYSELNKYELALKYANKFISLSSGSTYSLYNRGVMYYKLKKYKNAIDDFEKIIILEAKEGIISYTNPSKQWIENAKKKLSSK